VVIFRFHGLDLDLPLCFFGISAYALAVFLMQKRVHSVVVECKIMVVSCRIESECREGDDMGTTESNKAVIGKFIEEVINQNRMDQADDLVVEDFVELDPFPGQGPGREGLKEVLGMMRMAFPDIHWAVDEMVAEGDKVVTRFTWTGSHRSTFLGVPATGRSVTVKGVVIDQLANGKMSKSRILMDSMGMMQQLGVVPTA
jgi:steroid delta-isomerase-like uncharacterized protein